jgi:hypothetical protein
MHYNSAHAHGSLDMEITLAMAVGDSDRLWRLYTFAVLLD